jgi:ATP phosphoribosyltransferase regulatory subunit
MIICGNSKKDETSQVLVFGKAGHEVDAMRYVLDLQNKGIRAENSLFDSREESEEYAKKHGIKELAVIGDDVSVIPLSE